MRYLKKFFKPGFCIRNLLRTITDYHLGICSNLPTHHSGAMPALQNPVRAPI